jgi:hypothetical protein
VIQIAFYKLMLNGIRTAQMAGPSRFRLGCRRAALRLQRRIAIAAVA